MDAEESWKTQHQKQRQEEINTRSSWGGALTATILQHTQMIYINGIYLNWKI